MGTGFNGQVAISWSQTEIDGLEAAPLAHMVVGAAWSWRGRRIELSADADVYVQNDAYSNVVSALAARADVAFDPLAVAQGSLVELTNGAQKFTAELVQIVGGSSLMLIFKDGCPEADQEFWVSEAAENVEPADIGFIDDSKVIAFPGSGAGVIAIPADMPKIVGVAAE